MRNGFCSSPEWLFPPKRVVASCSVKPVINTIGTFASSRRISVNTSSPPILVIDHQRKPRAVPGGRGGSGSASARSHGGAWRPGGGVRRGLRSRQQHAEGRALSRLAIHPDRAAVTPDDPEHRGEPEPAP